MPKIASDGSRSGGGTTVVMHGTRWPLVGREGRFDEHEKKTKIARV